MPLLSAIHIKSPRRWLVLSATAVVLLLVLAATRPGSAAGPPPTPIPTPSATPSSPPSSPFAQSAPTSDASGVFGLLPDPRQWAADVFDQVLSNLVGTLSQGLHDLIASVLGSSLNFITQTPADGSYNSPTVQTLWNAVRLVSDAALVLVALWGGFNVMAREHMHAPYHEAMELFPRLALGALLVNTSLSWGQIAIDANNALCQVIGQTSLPAWEKADRASQLLADSIATLIYLITSLLLLLQMLMRLALVDVLLVVAPLGLLCWVLPQTQGWARLWSHTFTAAVFTQFVQVVTLKLGGSLMTDLTPMAPDSALLSVFLGIAVLVLTLKIPGLLRTHVGDGLGFARVVIYGQAARAITGGVRSGRSSGGAG